MYQVIKKLVILSLFTDFLTIFPLATITTVESSVFFILYSIFYGESSYNNFTQNMYTVYRTVHKKYLSLFLFENSHIYIL